MKKNIIFAIFILLLGACEDKNVSDRTAFEVTVIDENEKPISDFEFTISFEWNTAGLLPGKRESDVMEFRTDSNGVSSRSTKMKRGGITLVIDDFKKRTYRLEPFKINTREGEINIPSSQIKFKELNKLRIIRLKE